MIEFMTTVTAPERTEEFLLAIGDPRTVLKELELAKRSANALSTSQPRMVDRYPNKWIALHDGGVVADSDTIDGLFARVNEIDPTIRHRVLVRFISRHQQTLIL